MCFFSRESQLTKQRLIINKRRYGGTKRIMQKRQKLTTSKKIVKIAFNILADFINDRFV